MKWEILVLTMPQRAFLLRRLLNVLDPQISQYSDVKVIVHEHDPQLMLGDNRECLRSLASAEYINFIDDDDLVSPNYVAKIYELLDGVDYVGFQVAVYRSGVYEPTLKTSISLRHGTWSHDDRGYYCDISHLAPMRRSLALAVPMSGGKGEDARWAAELRNRRIVLSEHYIPEFLYQYFI